MLDPPMISPFVLPSAILGFVTCFVVYLFKLNRRERRGDFRHWDGRNIFRTIFGDLPLQYSVGRPLSSFLYFWAVVVFYSCIFFSFIRYFNVGSFVFLPIIAGSIFLVIARILSELSLAILEGASGNHQNFK